MSNLKRLRDDARDICYAIAEDDAESAEEYLTSLQPMVLALFTAQCLVIIAELAFLNDYEVGDFSGPTG